MALKSYLSTLKRPYILFSDWFFHPGAIWRRWRGVPYFLANARRYRSLHSSERFPFRLADVYYRSHDRFDDAGPLAYHYFHQDLWAARKVYDSATREHVDVGSRLDGFVAHVLPFCKVVYVDIRALKDQIENLEYRRGSITDLPFDTGSVTSLSCLHVIEHIGLGRYGDRVDPDGYLTAARELTRVLAPGGRLLLGTPVGRERLQFDAHRIFDPATILDAFSDLKLDTFMLIDDASTGVMPDPDFLQARACNYGCGLFEFTKPAGPDVASSPTQ